EDGIRGFHVTGVQTCALPIFLEAELQAMTTGGGVEQGLHVARREEGDPGPIVPAAAGGLPRPGLLLAQLHFTAELAHALHGAGAVAVAGEGFALATSEDLTPIRD